LPRYIYGEDPASQNDFFVIVIPEMPSPTKNNPSPLPLLRDIYKINHTSFDKIIEFHTQVLFRKYSPTLMVFEYINERTFTDSMKNRFGKSRVAKINFSAGTSGTKKLLKEMDYLVSVKKRDILFENKDYANGHIFATLMNQTD